MTKLKVGMISLGCNKNRVDSETALGLLREHGYELTNDPAQADVLMVNTCGFKATAAIQLQSFKGGILLWQHGKIWTLLLPTVSLPV